MGKRRSRANEAMKKLDRKDRKHLMEFGEMHPIYNDTEDFEVYRKVKQQQHRFDEDKTETNIEESRDTLKEEEEASEEVSTKNAYSLLLADLLGNNQHHHDDDDDETSFDPTTSPTASSPPKKKCCPSDVLTTRDTESEDDVSDNDDTKDDDCGADEWEVEDPLSVKDNDDINSELDDETELVSEDVNFDETAFYENHFDLELTKEVLNELKTDHSHEKVLNSSYKIVSKESSDRTSDGTSALLSNISIDECRITKQSLLNNFKSLLSNDNETYTKNLLTYALLHQYNDVHDCVNSSDSVRYGYCLHALIHVLKTRKRILLNNAKLKHNSDLIFRDQGFTRPKVLVIVPFRESARHIINILIKLIKSEGKEFVTNKKLFRKRFGSVKVVPTDKKPPDWNKTFSGNTDDHFRIGISIARRTVKLFCSFYKSDIIIASPLGIRTMSQKAKGEKENIDFFSSIEVLIIDEAEVLFMQNWEHVLHAFKMLNKIPVEQHNTDFSRVRLWYLDGLSRYYRQTAVFSTVMSPYFSSLLSKHCHNFAGRVDLKPLKLFGDIVGITIHLNQVFERFCCKCVQDEPDERFKYLTTKILPARLNSPLMKNSVLFISSFFSYIRIRNYLKKNSVNFVSLCEYADKRSIDRARYLFFHEKVPLMLVTERFHFYKRYKIRGINHMIFYELPVIPHFYSEFCNFLYDPKRPCDSPSCTVLYCKFDAVQLINVLGYDRASILLENERSSDVFTSNKISN